MDYLIEGARLDPDMSGRSVLRFDVFVTFDSALFSLDIY
jgi:hypothetical protein